MKHTLISSIRSPFGRICRMLMIQAELNFEFRILNFVDDAADAAKLSVETPINKVPVLVLPDGQKIFDSRVIANHLIANHGLHRLSLDEENIVSAIYSCLDVSVVLFLMNHNGYDLSANNGYLTRQKDRIPRNMEFIRSWAEGLNPKNAADWNYASMSLYSWLDWGSRRAKTFHLSDYPHFEKFLKAFSNHPGVQASTF